MQIFCVYMEKCIWMVLFALNLIPVFEPMKEKQPWIRTIIVITLIHTSYHSYLGKVHPRSSPRIVFLYLLCVLSSVWCSARINLWMCRRKTPPLQLTMATRTQHKPTFTQKLTVLYSDVNNFAEGVDRKQMLAILQLITALAVMV